MLTEFQNQKLTVLFHQQDMDDDGFVGKADYEAFAERICEAQGFAPGSAEYETVFTQTMAAWDHVQRVADKDQDNLVSLEEYLASYDITLGDEHLFDQLVRGYAASITDAWDRDGDGRVSGIDYVALSGCYGIEDEAAREAFRHLDVGGRGYLTTQDLVKRFEEFLGDDPDAPGNWLVGPY